MARQVLVLEEILAMLKVIGAPNRVVDAFRDQAERVLEKKPEKNLDAVSVSSGFGQTSRVGFVELTLNETRSQMDAKKAREIGLMLIEAAEAAASDEIFVKLLERIGVESVEQHGRILLELRELRQGTRGVSWPS